MMQDIQFNNFDRNKPFYPYILFYVTSLHGVIDLCSRGLTNKLRNVPVEKRTELLEKIQNLTPSIQKDFLTYEGNQPLIGDLALTSKFQKNKIKVNINEIANEFINIYSPDIFIYTQLRAAAAATIVMCYELSYEKSDNKTELWNFFYHCRNAAAHDGRFFIRSSNKRFPAKWGELEITKESHSTRLLLDSNKSGLIGPGDVVRLLWDIEQSL